MYQSNYEPNNFFKKLQEADIVKQLFDSAPYGILIIRRGGQILASNKQSEKIFGYDNDELLNYKISDLVPLQKRTNHTVNCDNFFKQPHKKKMSSLNENVKGVRKDKSKFTIETTLSPITVDNELLVFCTVQNITKQVTIRTNKIKTEQALFQSYEELKEALEGTISVLSKTIDKRDPYTAGHQQRVASLAYAIAKEMELDDQKAESVRICALVHDIGKVAVPIEILSKPGKISKDEFKVIQVHPKAGYDILKDVKFPWPVAEAAYQHLERIDGSGYPRGLKGDQIIIEAKIISLADVVEAMASHRPYRPSLGIDAAITEITKNKDTLYDSAVVDACVKLFKEKNFQFD